MHIAVFLIDAYDRLLALAVLDNGIASIDKFIGKDYSRVRIGIGKPKNGIEVADYVLQNFDEDESIGIEKISKDITESISILVEKKLDLFSSAVNNK